MSFVLGVAFCISLLVVHIDAVRNNGRMRINALLLDAIVGGLVAVAVFNTALFQEWMQEDGWAEWATVVAFLMGAVLYGKGFMQETSFAPRWLERTLLISLAAFCLFVAGEEISWGQRLFAFEPPELFLEQNYQQETNVHNVLKDRTLLGFELESRNLVALIALLHGVAAPLLTRIAQVRFLHHLRPLTAPIQLLPWFLGVAWAEVAYPTPLTGEAAEMVLGLLFAVDAFERFRGQTDPPEGSRASVALVALPIAAGLLIQPAVELFIYGSDEEGKQQCLDELRDLSADVLAAFPHAEKLQSRRRVHKRLFTAIRQDYLSVDAGRFLNGHVSPATDSTNAARRDRRGYFLDPWHNPYWILFERRFGRIIVYSFGPNRRRDTNTRQTSRQFRARGDDIAVVLQDHRRRERREGDGP